MSTQAGFVTKNGNLSAKALKRIFKDGIGPTKLAKRKKVAKTTHLENQEEEWEEIPIPKTSKRPVEVLDKKRRLQEAAEILITCGANTKELLSALGAAQTAQRTSNITEDVTSKVSRPPNSPPTAWRRGRERTSRTVFKIHVTVRMTAG